MKIIKLDDFKITTDETLRLIYEVQAYIDSTKIRLNTDIDIEYFCKNFNAVIGSVAFKQIKHKELVIIEDNNKLCLSVGLCTGYDITFLVSIRLNNEEYTNYKAGQNEN